MMVAETWISHIAQTLGVSPNEIRLNNFQKEGEETPYKQVLKKTDVTAEKCFQELLIQTDFDKRVKEVHLRLPFAPFSRLLIIFLPPDAPYRFFCYSSSFCSVILFNVFADR